MAVDLYETILQELGQAMGMKLKADQHHTCLIHLKTGLELYFEMDRKGVWFVMGAILGQVPPGIYRQNLFAEALKSNGKPPPHVGIFAYSTQAQALLYYRLFRAEQLTGEEVFATIPIFTKTALEWKDAIDRGVTPQVGGGQEEKGVPSSGIFGLR